jgi:hypothetical protein
MNAIQKKIAVVMLALNAVFFHVLFTSWALGEFHRSYVIRHGGNYPNYSTLVMPIGPFAGIYARSPETHAIDAVLGVAFPVTLIGLALFILARPRLNAVQRSMPEQ